MLQTSDNPDGPLPKEQAAEMTAGLTKDEDTFHDQFTTDFFSVDGTLVVSEENRQQALTLAKQASKTAAIAGSELHVVAGGPHGVTVSHPEEWNRVVLAFLAKERGDRADGRPVAGPPRASRPPCP